MSVNGRPTLPSRAAMKRAVAVAVLAGVGAGLPLIAAGGASAATPEHRAPQHHSVQQHHHAAQHAAPVQQAAAPVRTAPQAAPVAQQQAAPASYTVVSGDTLSKIATSHSVQGGWQSLFELNKSVLPHGPNMIFPGQHLSLGGHQQAAAPAVQQQSAPVQQQSAPATDSSSSANSAGSDNSGNSGGGSSQQSAPAAQTAVTASTDSSAGSLQALAASIVPADQLASFDQIISHESGWSVTATNPSSGAYGLPQALPGNKMASAGADWQTNPATQIKWALQYMNDTYGSPNAAWAFWQTHSAY
ncbi:LysM peptidoglycan-binding domain-containing protein [Kitasatospora viridis]|uniref:Transglycosylase-like protein with SLT domain n=1 Tax=Kitasatospora viridis TaxID=281105 RepID=A0A561TTX9_9ACTN|nr:LysM peptidoglycan-binding domain-containing protein [Kitasatospora viridis]TWF90572.1 transglycosylase-like protein with SLT domain [Kitasatospora viridis]